MNKGTRMKVLVIKNNNGITSVYKGDTKEELNKAVYNYLSSLYKPEKFLEEELYKAFVDKSEDLYIELRNSYIENADITSLELITVEE